MRLSLEKLFFQGAIRDYLNNLAPSPAVESFANSFIRENEHILGNDAKTEYKPATEPDVADEGIIVYHLSPGKDFYVGVKKREDSYPEATLGVQYQRFF